MQGCSNFLFIVYCEDEFTSQGSLLVNIIRLTESHDLTAENGVEIRVSYQNFFCEFIGKCRLKLLYRFWYNEEWENETKRIACDIFKIVGIRVHDDPLFCWKYWLRNNKQCPCLITQPTCHCSLRFKCFPFPFASRNN